MTNSPNPEPASPAKSASPPAQPAGLPSPPPQPAESPSSPAQPAQQDDFVVLDPTILPASHWQQLPVPPLLDDADSTLGSMHSVNDSTASLTSSILEYRTVHGRSYASDRGRSEVWEPSDEKHLESMDMSHHLFTLILDGKLFLSPLKNDIQKVLDIGTGTGVWAIDVADEFPAAEVIGTDVAPIQPSWVPPNCRFEIDDANEDHWTWRDNTFDFVHSRGLYGSIVDWNEFYKKAFRVCKPGGYMEDYEWSTYMSSDDGTVVEGSPIYQWHKVFWEAGRKFGRTFKVVEDDMQEKGMREAGFVDIQVKTFKAPLTPWPKERKAKEIGLFTRTALEMDAEGYVLYIWGSVMGWSEQEIQVYLAHFRRQLRDPKVHAWNIHRVVYGRKPE